MPSSLATTQKNGCVRSGSFFETFTPRTTRSPRLIHSAISRLMIGWGSSTVCTSFDGLREIGGALVQVDREEGRRDLREHRQRDARELPRVAHAHEPDEARGAEGEAHHGMRALPRDEARPSRRARARARSGTDATCANASAVPRLQPMMSSVLRARLRVREDVRDRGAEVLDGEVGEAVAVVPSRADRSALAAQVDRPDLEPARARGSRPSTDRAGGSRRCTSSSRSRAR